MKKHIFLLGILLATSLHCLHSAAQGQELKKLKCQASAEGYRALLHEFDFHKSKQIFKELVDRYAIDDPMRVDAELGLASAYHMLGDFEHRDGSMSTIKKLLQLPDDLSEYKENFNPLAASYYTLDGYREFIKSAKALQSQNFEMQEKYLSSARRCFSKGLEIARLFSDKETQGLAHRGLGTVYEFLSKEEKRRGGDLCSQGYNVVSTEHFKNALKIRIEFFGAKSAMVARIHHKLGRSYQLGGDREQAKEHYEQAKSIYKEVGIAETHPFVQELMQECGDN